MEWFIIFESTCMSNYNCEPIVVLKFIQYIKKLNKHDLVVRSDSQAPLGAIYTNRIPQSLKK